MSADYYYKPVFNYYRKKKQMHTLSTKGVYMVTQWIPNVLSLSDMTYRTYMTVVTVVTCL